MTSLTINNSGDGSFENPFKQIPKTKDRIPYAYYLNKKGQIRVWNAESHQLSVDTKIFIKLAREIHGNKYDYSKVDYINADTQVIIICPIHKEFKQTPYHHLCRGQGCNDCGTIRSANKQRNSKEEFIQKAKQIHGDKYDYSKVVYINSNTPVIIICHIHTEFKQIPYNHLMGKGCNSCGELRTANKARKTREDFIQKARKIHGDKYDYSKVIYIDCKTKVIIICPIHREFEIDPDHHINQKSGCPKCVNKTEGKVYNWLKELFPFIDKSYTNWKPTWFERNFEFDIVFHELKLIIEIDGEQHYSFKQHITRHFNKNTTTQERIETDVYKMKKANENGYSVIRIIQLDIWEDKNNWENNLFAAIKPYDTPTNIFICSNNEYEHHKRLL